MEPCQAHSEDLSSWSERDPDGLQVFCGLCHVGSIVSFPEISLEGLKDSRQDPPHQLLRLQEPVFSRQGESRTCLSPLKPGFTRLFYFFNQSGIQLEG